MKPESVTYNFRTGRVTFNRAADGWSAEARLYGSDGGGLWSWMPSKTLRPAIGRAARMLRSCKQDGDAKN